jgi:Tfp pilus assembly protein PilF
MRAVHCALCILMALTLGACAHSRPSHEVTLRLDLAEAYLASRKPQLALQELLATSDRAQHLPRYHFDLGMTYYALDQLDQAQTSLKRAVEIDPTYGEAWNNLGRVLEVQKRTEEAAAAYQRALSILTYATPELAAVNLARLHLGQGKPEEAESLARLAIRRNWLYAPAYILLAQILESRGDLKAAQETLEEGIAANLNAPALKLALAENMLRQGKTTEAKALFHELTQRHAGSHEASLAKDYLGILP